MMNLSKQFFVNTKLILVSGWRKWEAARHGTMMNHPVQQSLLISRKAAPTRERNTESTPAHPPCPRTHPQPPMLLH